MGIEALSLARSAPVQSLPPARAAASGQYTSAVKPSTRPGHEAGLGRPISTAVSGGHVRVRHGAQMTQADDPECRHNSARP